MYSVTLLLILHLAQVIVIKPSCGVASRYNQPQYSTLHNSYMHYSGIIIHYSGIMPSIIPLHPMPYHIGLHQMRVSCHLATQEVCVSRCINQHALFLCSCSSLDTQQYGHSHFFLQILHIKFIHLNYLVQL